MDGVIIILLLFAIIAMLSVRVGLGGVLLLLCFFELTPLSLFSIWYLVCHDCFDY